MSCKIYGSQKNVFPDHYVEHMECIIARRERKIDINITGKAVSRPYLPSSSVDIAPEMVR